MKNKVPKLLIFLGISVSSIFVAAPAFSCGCCGVPNTWSRSSAIPSDNIRSVITDRLNLLGEIGHWSARGSLLPMEGSSVPLSGTMIAPETWEFSFSLNHEGPSQPISFVFEADSAWEFSSFDIDVVGDSPTYSESVALLYKEIMIPGSVLLSRELAEAIGAQQTAGRFIFQGYGNHCTDSNSFSNWVFQILAPNNSGFVEITGVGRL